MGNSYNDKYHNNGNKEFNNDSDEDEEENSFSFYAYLAPYNMENKEIGEIKLYNVNSRTKVP